MRKVWDIHGGVHPPENKLQSLQSPIADIPLPSKLIIPLNQHIGAPATPSVEVGDTVLKGQVIANAQGVFSANVHASTSGTITAIEEHVIAHPSGLKALCAVIEPDGLDHWCELTPCKEYQQLDHFELVEKIRQAGLAGMGGAGFPTAVKLNPKALDTVETLIINGTECEPYITADDALMREHAIGIVEGAKLLARIIGTPKEILIGVEDNKPQAIAALQEATTGTNVDVVVFPTKYPSGGEKQLIQILTGKELPSGTLPAHMGVLVQNVGTAYAAWRAVRYGEPLIERITTVVGKALGKECNVRARIGTPIQHLLDSHGFNEKNAARLIIGGPMMGFAVTNTQVPVVKTTNCVLAPSHAEMPPPPPAQACIRCGLCAEACPANLLPQQLYWYAKAEDYERLQSHNLMDCIECGACSFVCPSAIPLVQYYRSAKGTIRIQEAEKQKADRARERFDQRKARIEKAEAEKAAKRAARKKAAEEAKKKLEAQKTAEAASGNATSTTEVKPGLVAQAVANAKNAPVSKETQLKKLNRALSSAQSRVERVQKQLSECEPEKKEKLQASLKQAELKVQEAQTKLTAFNFEQSANGTSAASDMEQATETPDLVAQAIANAKAAKTSDLAPEAQLKKLNRALSSAQSREERVQKQLAECEPEKKEKLEAALKQAQIKVADAQKKVDAFNDRQASGADSAETALHNKLSASPLEAQASTVEKLEKRLHSAEQKLTQAKEAGAATVNALEQGAEKIRQKLLEAKAELDTLKTQPEANQKVALHPEVKDAATLAIEKAKAKAAAATLQSPEEKRAAQIDSLKTRITKAEQKLQAAKADNSEHVDTLEQSLNKLKTKLSALEAEA